MKESKKR